MNEAIIVLQPSLHGSYEFVELVLGEAEALGCEVGQLILEHQEQTSPEHEDEILQECLQALWDAEYPNVLQEDTFLVWPKGTEVPEEWRE